MQFETDCLARDGQVRPGALAPINGNLEALPFASGSFEVVMSRVIQPKNGVIALGVQVAPRTR